MRRRLLNFLTALSMLMCVAVAALWVVSARSPALVRIQLPAKDDDERWISVTGGRVSLVEEVGWPDFHDPLWGERYEVEVFGVGKGGQMGRKFFDNGASAGVYYRWREVRLWLLVTAFAALPAFRLARRWTTGRWHHHSGMCRSCGYDLRATPDRCPECGHTPAGVTP